MIKSSERNMACRQREMLKRDVSRTCGREFAEFCLNSGTVASFSLLTYNIDDHDIS